MRTAINQAWPRGIQEELILIVGCEFKIKGTPCWCDGEETVFMRPFGVKYFETYETIQLESLLNIKIINSIRLKKCLFLSF